MPDLGFTVDAATAVDGSLTPLLEFALSIEEVDGRDIDTIALSCQIMIEAVRRPYAAMEQEALLDLFGTPERWGTSLKTMLWTHASTVVPGFEGRTTVTLAVPASFDLSLAATKYFFALEGGEVPLTFQFSGTVFYRDANDALMTERISVDQGGALPVAGDVWRDLDGPPLPRRCVALPASRRLRSAVSLQGETRGADVGDDDRRAARECRQRGRT